MAELTATIEIKKVCLELSGIETRQLMLVLRQYKLELYANNKQWSTVDSTFMQLLDKLEELRKQVGDGSNGQQNTPSTIRYELVPSE